MTNEELKEKIISLLGNSYDEWISIQETTIDIWNFKNNIPREKLFISFDKIADTLIAAGLRFGENLTATFDHMALEREHELERRLAEAEHRAEVAERALRDIATYCAKEDFDCFSLTTVAVEARAKELYDGWVQKSEKELKGKCKK